MTGGGGMHCGGGWRQKTGGIELQFSCKEDGNFTGAAAHR